MSITQQLAKGKHTTIAGRITSLVAFTLLAAFLATANSAEPYLPKEDDEVLETLPRTLLSGWDELTILRRQLAEDRNNPELAYSVASQYLQIGNQEGDPRFYGYARAAISFWWEASSPAPVILRLRAKLKEKDHLYDLALADLHILLEQQPRDAQAWIEVANIYRVQGKYAEAQQACESLSQFAGSARTLLCNVPIQAVTGQAKVAYESLEKILPTAQDRWPSAVPWMLTMQANIAWALDDEEQAERHFRAGLAENPGDTSLLRIYADFLLDRHRDEEVLSLLREHARDNGILLRAAIAARRSDNNKLAAKWLVQLESRFEELRLRGNQPHGRFEARFELELKNNPQRALIIALENWRKQKEARDTRNVLEAAIAANDSAAAQPVLKFLTENGTEDVVLQKLAKQLENL